MTKNDAPYNQKVTDTLWLEDARALSRYRSLLEVSRFQSWETFSVSEAEELIRANNSIKPWCVGRWYQWAIRVDGKLVGDVGTFVEERKWKRTMKIGYSLDPQFQGKGLMTRALLELFDGARAEQIEVIEAWTDPRNHASIRLLERLGFQKEAEVLNSAFLKGE